MRGEAKRKTRGGEKNKAPVALPPTSFAQKSTNGGDVKMTYLWNSGIPAFGVRNSVQGIWNPAKDWYLESKAH